MLDVNNRVSMRDGRLWPFGDPCIVTYNGINGFINPLAWRLAYGDEHLDSLSSSVSLSTEQL